MLTLTNAVSRVASRLNKNASDTTVVARIKNHINDVCQEKWHGYAWSFRWREYPITLSAQVTTGTLTATNASNTVTSSSAIFDATIHKGAWVRFTADTVQAWYKIKNVSSTTSVIVEPAYQGTTGSSKAYQLCKTDYLLPTEVSDLGAIKMSVNGQPLPVQNQLLTDGYYQPSISTGIPYSVTLFNQTQAYASYTAGTVSGTINTLTLTGSGTSWLANVTPGDEIVLNGDTSTYKVHSVDTDTQITLYNNLVVAPTGASYTISRQFGKVLRFQPCPDNPYVVFVKGLRAYSPLVNNADTNELLAKYPYAVIEGAVWREASSSPDQREDSLYQKSEKMWFEAQSDDELLLPQANFMPIWDPRQTFWR